MLCHDTLQPAGGVSFTSIGTDRQKSMYTSASIVSDFNVTVPTVLSNSSSESNLLAPSRTPLDTPCSRTCKCNWCSNTPRQTNSNAFIPCGKSACLGANLMWPHTDFVLILSLCLCMTRRKFRRTLSELEDCQTEKLLETLKSSPLLERFTDEYVTLLGKVRLRDWLSR